MHFYFLHLNLRTLIHGCTLPNAFKYLGTLAKHKAKDTMWVIRAQACTQFHCHRSYLSCEWVSGCPDTKTGLTDFSVVLRAARVLWPSWTHYIDSAAEYFGGMFVNVQFCLGRNWHNTVVENRRSRVAISGMGFNLKYKLLEGIYFHVVNARKMCFSTICVCSSALEHINFLCNVHRWATLPVWAPKCRFPNTLRLVKHHKKYN